MPDTHTEVSTGSTQPNGVCASQAATPALARPIATSLPRLSSHHILGNAREVVIDHQGMEYRLRHTRAGKLILTK